MELGETPYDYLGIQQQFFELKKKNSQTFISMKIWINQAYCVKS